MSLKTLANSLSRSGISLKISKFQTKDLQTKYGVYFTLEPKKIRFSFDDSCNSLPKIFRGNEIPENTFKEYLLGSIDGLIIKNSNEKLEFNFSRNFFNEVHISDAPLLHPPQSEMKAISIKGHEVGSMYSYYSLKNQLNFTDQDARSYRAQGNENDLNERPIESKLLYSMQRAKLDCIKEAIHPLILQKLIKLIIKHNRPSCGIK
jgi:hypothetical protein